MSDLTPEQINELAQAIRVADGSHDLGAGALAEALAPTVAVMINAARAEMRHRVEAVLTDRRSVYGEGSQVECLARTLRAALTTEANA